jgi:hypothetical protein
MMTIIGYRNAKDIDVQFNDEFNTILTNRVYDSFKKGTIKNPNYASVYSVGRLGEGNYGKKTDLKAYEAWRSMIQRCYDTKYQLKQPTYIGCTMCEEWHCFQNFAEWYYDNYYEVPGQTMALDKDTLYKGNRTYSPDTCVFVPQCINNLFTKCDKHRGNLPVGVSFHKQHNKYHSKCGDGSGHTIHLGYYDTLEQAFEAYKQYKEQVIKDMAEEYKDLIPEVLYNAMLNYEVEIND